jgi:repressor LexA
MSDVLSKKQKEIYEFIVASQAAKGYPPSVREICDAVNLQSTSTVHGHLSRLERKGFIKRDPSKPRALEILRSIDGEPLDRHSSDPTPKPSEPPVNNVIPFTAPGMPELMSVPILGKVTAGEPILAVENIEDYFAIPVEYAHNSDVFMLRVQGESMINAGIFSGDLILVRQQNTAINGDIVVALLGDSVTVKTFYREKGYIRLQPQNDHMDPILVVDCMILGKVIGLYRQY